MKRTNVFTIEVRELWKLADCTGYGMNSTLRDACIRCKKFDWNPKHRKYSANRLCNSTAGNKKEQLGGASRSLSGLRERKAPLYREGVDALVLKEEWKRAREIEEVCE